MPSNEHSTPIDEKYPRGTPTGPTDEEREFKRRMTIFGVVVLLLGVGAGWFVLSALKSVSPGNEIALSAPVEHTVVVVRLSAEKRRAAESMADHPVLARLAGKHRIRVQRVGDGQIALCAGRFESSDSQEATELLRRVRNYRRDGKRAFPDANIAALPARNSH